MLYYITLLPFFCKQFYSLSLLAVICGFHFILLCSETFKYFLFGFFPTDSILKSDFTDQQPIHLHLFPYFSYSLICYFGILNLPGMYIFLRFIHIYLKAQLGEDRVRGNSTDKDVLRLLLYPASVHNRCT